MGLACMKCGDGRRALANRRECWRCYRERVGGTRRRVKPVQAKDGYRAPRFAAVPYERAACGLELATLRDEAEEERERARRVELYAAMTGPDGLGPIDYQAARRAG